MHASPRSHSRGRPHWSAALFTLLLIGGLSRTVQAQGLPVPLTDPSVVRAMASMPPIQSWTLEQQISICE
ncbi:MAG: hypothetical protein ACKOH8_10245, partial [Gemmatimonadota bacterium]